MTWIRDDTPGHEGDLLGLVVVDYARRADGAYAGEFTLRYGDPYRELHGATDGPSTLWYGRYLSVVQLGCTCGWRSERLEAPTSACWRGYVDALPWFQEQCRNLWAAHAKGTVFGAQEAMKARAGP